MILTTEEVLTNLTNALAAEQDKNKIQAEQKAELVKALEEMLSIIGDSAGNSQFDMFKEVIDAKKLIEQAN